MKKIICMLSLFCAISLVGCGNDDVIENNEINNQEILVSTEETQKIESFITFKYTGLESLRLEGIVPEIVNTGKYYDVGNVKLGDKIYMVKFIAEKRSVDYYAGEFIEEKLVFFDGESEIKSFVLKTENGLDKYSREISIFKDKYVVTISDDAAGNTLQSLNIYDENLEVVNVKYIDGTEDDLYIDNLGNLRLHNGYENCYVINEENITYIRTDSTEEKFVDEKVTVRITETAEGLVAEIIERTKDGVKHHAGAAL